MPPTSQASFILPKATNQAIFQQHIQPALLRFSKPVANPVVVFLGGQPGSGKSSLALHYGRQFDKTGAGVVIINSDELREYHPDYANLQRTQPDSASFLVNLDTRLWQQSLIATAIAGRRHTLLDGTLGGDIKPILATIAQFRQAGYVVQLSVMSVPAYQSRLGIYQRYLDQVSRKGHGRWVGMKNHDDVYAQLPGRIDDLEQQQLVDEITVYARPVGKQSPEPVYENHCTNRQWVKEPAAGQALVTHRNRLLTYPEYQAHKAVVREVQWQWEQTDPSTEKTQVFLTNVEQQAIRHRLATAADVRLYFDWANDPVTRQQSFSSAPVPWETHEAWFARKLADPDALLLVFENGSGTPIGQVRFERVDAAELTAPIVVSWPETISFSIDVPFRGKGIAAGLIDEACRELRRKKGPVPIVAYIKPDNLASVRAFERAGFVRQDSPQADRLRLVKD